MAAPIKCLVWDLDNTLWKGTLLESDSCPLREGVRGVLKEMDARGILQSIASANDPEPAVSLLKRRRVDHFFLYPQIGWDNKVHGLQQIARKLNIPFDAMGFIDDEPYELEQVKELLPGVRTYAARDYRGLLRRPEFHPGRVTAESRRRRTMYLQEMERRRAEKRSAKSRREFLASCRTRLTLRRARRGDLPRILELMQRTHQLNATGKVYRTPQVRAFLGDPRYRVFVAELKDRFVDYGKIGAAVCECPDGTWVLRSFLLSCRVLSRGIAGVFLSWLVSQAFRQGTRSFAAEFRRTERNRRMHVLFRLEGFREIIAGTDGTRLLSKTCSGQFQKPDWLRVTEED